MRDFDGRRAAFWLIACVVGTHCIVVLAGIATCIYYAAEIVAGNFVCDKSGKLSELMAAALAAGLALTGAMRK